MGRDRDFWRNKIRDPASARTSLRPGWRLVSPPQTSRLRQIYKNTRIFESCFISTRGTQEISNLQEEFRIYKWNSRNFESISCRSGGDGWSAEDTHEIRQALLAMEEIMGSSWPGCGCVAAWGYHGTPCLSSTVQASPMDALPPDSGKEVVVLFLCGRTFRPLYVRSAPLMVCPRSVPAGIGK